MSLSVPSPSSAKGGQAKLIESTRSIVMSRATFTLFRGFNPPPTTEAEKALKGDKEEETTTTTPYVFVMSELLGAKTCCVPPNFKDFSDGKAYFRTLWSGCLVNGEVDDDAFSATEGEEAEATGVEQAVEAEGDEENHESVAEVKTVGDEETDEEAAAAGGWVSKEAAFTKRLVKVLESIPGRSFTATAEAKVEASDSWSAGKIDIAFTKILPEGNNDPPPPVVPIGLVEVAFCDDASGLDRKFWEKLNQSMKYLHSLRNDVDNWEWEEGQPLLVAVVVATRDCQNSRFAIFACEPKKLTPEQQKERRKRKSGKPSSKKRKSTPREFTASWRMALLWRKELFSLEELSEAFGTFVQGVDCLAKDATNFSIPGETWEYLGPNCTKVTVQTNGITKYVLRSYDNRVRQTSRSPRVYKKWKLLSDDTIQVLLVEDKPGYSVDFADLGVEGDDESSDDESSDKESSDKESSDNDPYHVMLFFRSKAGNAPGRKVEVIAVLYIEGSHQCHNAAEALRAVEHLKLLHDAGFVHGDVRALNIMFSAKSKLIDFDFGGHLEDDHPTYPPRYATFLPDGTRLGVGGKEIEQFHDVCALAQVIHDLHLPKTRDPRFFDLSFAESLWELEDILKGFGTAEFEPRRSFEQFLKSLKAATDATVKGGNKMTPDRITNTK